MDEQQGLSAAAARWQECADLVGGDVARTTDLSGHWRVEVREDEDARSAEMRRRLQEPRDGGSAYSSRLTITYGPPVERPRVPLLLPEIWLVAPGITEMPLPATVVDVADGVEEIAARVRDEVIDAIWSGWPVCPGHGHPAKIRGADWVCPTDLHRVAEIGRLGLPG